MSNRIIIKSNYIMKKFLVLIAMLAPMSMFAQKFAHFDMSQVLPNMAEYQTASAEMQKLGAQYQEEYDRLQKEFQTKYEEYQKLAEGGQTAEAILQSKGNELQKMQESIQDFAQASQQDIQKQQTEKMEVIQTKIMAVIKKIGEAGNYVYVVDVSAGAIPFVNTALSTDVTAQVKTELGIK